MWFDVHAALKKIEGGSACDTRDTATNDTKNAPIRANVADVADVADVAALATSENTPDTDAFEERAAICEFDGGLSRADAEDLAAQSQGYENVVAFRAAQTISKEGAK